MVSLHIKLEYCFNVFQITHVEIDGLLNSFCALEIFNLISKNNKLKVATDNTVDKLSSHMIKITKKKNHFVAEIFFAATGCGSCRVRP